MDNNTIIDDGVIEESKELNIASRGLRFANFLIDYVVIILLMVFTGPFLFGAAALSEQLVSNLIGIFYFVLYYFIFETLTKGKTIGKYITRTRAIMENGDLPTVGNILKRSLCRLIPFEPFSMFGQWAWHDSIPDMVVVKE